MPAKLVTSFFLYRIYSSSRVLRYLFAVQYDLFLLALLSLSIHIFPALLPCILSTAPISM